MMPRAFSPFDSRILAVASLIPLTTAGFAALRRPEVRIPATRLANCIVVAVAAFFTLTDAYLVMLAAR